jgi:hypothetical protein
MSTTTIDSNISIAELNTIVDQRYREHAQLAQLVINGAASETELLKARDVLGHVQNELAAALVDTFQDKRRR